MTIGADIPLRSQFEALVRDSGKGDRTNDQRMPKEDSALDFKTMVKVALPKLKLGTDDAAQEETLAEPDETVESGKDKPSTASVQGVFGQTILAFEQLLERQRQDQGVQTPVPDKASAPAEPGSMPAPAEIVLAAVDEAAPQDMPLPGGKTEKPAEAMTKSIPRQTIPDLVVKPEEGKSQPAPAQPLAGDTVAAEIPKIRSGARAAVEQPAALTVNTTAATPPVSTQAEAKLAAMPAPVTPQPTSRPQVTDIEILSDRATGAARTLVIQLQPIELGTVTARLRLTSEGMHIQLTAENRVMAEHLAKDHEALGKALQRAGVGDDASSVTISVIDRSSTSSNTPAGQQNFNGQEQQAGARANGQGHSGFQGTPDDRSTSQQPFGDILPDEREEKLAMPGVEDKLSRGLVV